jgi:phosphoglycolate phosphatase
MRGILFDKDGTLIDYWKTWLPINRETALFAAHGDHLLADELLRCGGQDPATDTVVPGSALAVGSHDEIAAVFAARLGGAAPANLAREIERIFRRGGARHSVLIDGVAVALESLKRDGFRLGLATNDSVGGLQSSLGRHDVLRHFDFYAGCDSGFGVKPGPGMVLAFCKVVGLEPCNIVVVGDAVHDLEMARRAGAGMKVGVLTGTSPRKELAPHADLIIESVAELPAHLDRCAGPGS